MTINGGSKLLYCSKVIENKAIYHVVQQQYELQKRNTLRKRPKVVIDANLIGYQFIFKGIGPARAVLIIAREFLQECIDVSIVCDNGELRHHSKRATINRNGKRHRGRVQLMEHRIELSNLLRSSDSESPENIERRKFLEQKIKSLEKATNNFLPANFISEMKQMVDDYHPENKGVIKLLQTPFQADP